MTNRLFILVVIFINLCSTVNATPFEDAEKAYSLKDYKKAMSIWQGLANQNNISAQLQLAAIYTSGIAVEKNLQTAFDLYYKSAQLGSAEAQNQLGKLYLTAQGVDRNPAESRKWYMKAADQGYAEAMYNLGVTYFKGDGITTDYTQAHAWMHVAVIMGYAPAENYRDQLAEVLSKKKLKDSKQISNKLLNKFKSKEH